MNREVGISAAHEALKNLPRQKLFHLKRDFAGEDTTLGSLITPEGLIFGWTLEDKIREKKIKGVTCIPETKGGDTYHLGIRQSPKYGEVVVIYTRKEGDVYILEYGGMRFDYILIHGGNTHKDTDGCVLLAKNRNGLSIQGSLKKEIAESVKRLLLKGYDCRLKVSNP